MLPTLDPPHGWAGMAWHLHLYWKEAAVTSISNPSGDRAMVSTQQTGQETACFQPSARGSCWFGLPGLQGSGGHRPESRRGRGERRKSGHADVSARKGLRGLVRHKHREAEEAPQEARCGTPNQ